MSEELTLEERIDAISQELMATAFMFIERVKEGGKITPEEEEAQKQKMQQLKIIESTYIKIRKMGRISGGTNDENFTKGLKGVMGKIKDMPSSIGNISTAVPNQ